MERLAVKYHSEPLLFVVALLEVGLNTSARGAAANKVNVIDGADGGAADTVIFNTDRIGLNKNEATTKQEIAFDMEKMDRMFFLIQSDLNNSK
jgi:hypothetical protein